MRKKLSFVLAAALLLAGCGGGSSQTTQTTQAASGDSGAQSGGASQDSGSSQDGEVTFTFSKVSYPSVTLPDGQTSADNVVIDYIRDKYHVNMVLDWQAESSEYNNKLSLKPYL